MRRPRRLSTLAAATVAGLVLTGCSGSFGAPNGLSGLANGDIAARANDGDVVITVRELQEATELALAGAPQDDLSPAQLLERRLQVQTGVLTNELQIAIVVASARDDFGIEVSDADVAAVVADEAAALGGEDALDVNLTASGQTRETFERNVFVNLLIEALFDALLERDPVTDADVEAAYEQRAGQFELVEARHILVETEAEAIAALGRIEAGDDFGDVAVELSQDPGSGPNGGALGANPRGTFVPEFEAAIWDGPATVGEVLGPVQTQFGFHLIVVDAFQVTPRAEALDQVRAELEPARANDLLGAWASQAFSDADPEVAGRFGRWDRTQQAVVNDRLPAEDGA